MFTQSEVDFFVNEAKKELTSEYIEDLENLPIEIVTWVKEHTIRKSKFAEMVGKVQSSMIFLPEITRLIYKWKEVSKK